MDSPPCQVWSGLFGLDWWRRPPPSSHLLYSALRWRWCDDVMRTAATRGPHKNRHRHQLQEQEGLEGATNCFYIICLNYNQKVDEGSLLLSHSLAGHNNKMNESSGPRARQRVNCPINSRFVLEIVLELLATVKLNRLFYWIFSPPQS